VGAKPVITGGPTAGVTLRFTVRGAIVIPTAVALTLMEVVTAGVAAVVLIVSTKLVPVVGSLLKEAVMPGGAPLTAKSTAPLKFVR
jgi:hypothetical protein